MANRTPVLAVGLTTVDVVQRVRRRPGPDEKVTASRGDVHAGGPAAGAAVTAAALGASVRLVTALGHGPLRELAASDLRDRGVEVLDHTREGALAVSSVWVVEGTGERSVVSRDAEGLRVDADEDALGRLLADARRPAAVLVDGHHLALAVPIARAARARGVPVLLDAGSWKPGLEDLLPHVDLALASAVFRTPGAGDAEASVAALFAAGVGEVAVSAGAGPVLWWSVVGAAPRELAVPQVRAVDTLGAGDALHGGVLVGLARGEGTEAALRRGIAVASHRVAHVGNRSWLASAGDVG